jgi:hypothetical protein
MLTFQTRVLSAFVSACAAFVAASTSAQTDFPRPIFPTGGNPTAFARGDLNLDGLPDAAVVHSSTDQLGLIYAEPGGGFSEPILFATGDQPAAVAIADFDLDNRPDVVTVNTQSATLTVVLLRLSGPVVLTVPGIPNGDLLAVGDLDHDGDPDVVAGNGTQHTLSVLLKGGPAGFAAPVVYPVGARPGAIALEDFDGDGSLDVATANSIPGTVTLWHGNGAGALLGPTTLVSTSQQLLGLVAADLDVDGDLDLATGDLFTTDLILVRNGPGGFGAPEIMPAGATLEPLAAADLDLDGLPDLLVRAFPPGGFGAFSRMAGTGGAAFAAPVPLLPMDLADLVVDDADGDLRPDVVGLSGGLCVFRGDGEGGLVSSPSVAVPEQAAIFALADLDGDGVDDLVSADSLQTSPVTEAGPVHVQLGDGAGGFGQPELQPVDAADFIELADVTGDGALDLLTTAGFPNAAIVVAAGNGSGGFAAPTSVAMPSLSATGLEAADFDLDGDVDLAVLATGGEILGPQSRSLIAFRNGGAGQWTSFAELYAIVPQFEAQDHLALGDCDGDGQPDAVVLRASGPLSFCAGGGTEAFGSPLSLGNAGTNSGHQPLVLGDLDGDGALDIVVAANPVQAWFGQGNGTFGLPQSLGAGPGDDVRIADLDGDGPPEIVMDGSTSSLESKTVMVWHAAGSGYDRELYFSEPLSRTVLIDAGQDGMLDLLALEAHAESPAPDPADGHLLLNHTLLAAWTDLGHGLAGSLGVPKLAGTGTLAADSPGSLKLTGANPSKLAVLFIGASANPTPFKGGVLVPVPPAIMFSLFTSPTGTITVGWSSWKLMPPGTDLFFQYGIVDSAAPAGASLSNALRLLQP